MRAEKGFSSVLVAILVAVSLLTSSAFVGLMFLDSESSSFPPSERGQVALESPLQTGRTLQIYPSADVYAIDSSSPYWNSPQLKFDISLIDGPVESARLYLYDYTSIHDGGWNGSGYVMRVDGQTWDETIENYEFDAQLVTNVESFDNKWFEAGTSYRGWDWVDVQNQLTAENGDNLTLRLSDINSGWQTQWISDWSTLFIGSDYDPNLFYSSEASENRPYLEVTVSGLVSHPPIYIKGNENFTSANGVTGGSGTKSDPYIIENWYIDSGGRTDIHIENTTAYFVIRNCYLFGTLPPCGDGIHLRNVVNGKIDNVTADSNHEGIGLYFSSNNTILNSIVKETFGSGIELGTSSNNIIENCTIFNNLYGIYLGPYSDNNVVRNCTIKNNGDGIGVNVYADNNRIFHNKFVTNYQYQARDYGSNYWDDGYPSGGNYWSDYTGSDANGDGIGDTPYGSPGDNNQDRYPLMEPWPVAHLGMAAFRLENLYAVHLEENLYLNEGSKLVVKFYTYANDYENERVIETFTPPWHVEENEIARHPNNIGVKKARLDLTTDNTEEVISTIASFTVRKVHLESRFMDIPFWWSQADAAGKVELETEFMGIPFYCSQAPS